MHLEANEREHMRNVEPPDTEITLGTGKMLVLFFGLVVLCSLFFALGFKLGKGSVSGVELAPSPASTSTSNAAAKPATKPGTNPADLTFYKAVGQNTPSTQLTPPQTVTKSADSDDSQPTSTPPEQTAPAASNYLVQVAAVSKREDAEALVDALKKKQYAAFATVLADKLYHVQVGPYNDIKDAEATRVKLVGDGYNPILKK
jgi:DedD protein